MAFWNKYPYTDFHELNLDWILDEIQKMGRNIDEFISNYKNPVITDNINDITNTNYVYLYVGPDYDTFLNRHWYYYDTNANEWVDGGLYGSAIIDNELSTTSTNAVENRVIANQFNTMQEAIDDISSDAMQANSTPMYYETALDKMCALYLPPNHTAQAIEYLNGYLYVFHHINDSTENQISKFLWTSVLNASTDDTVMPTDVLSINHNTHGNTLCAYDNFLILSDVVSGIRSVTIINTDTFTASDRIELLSGTTTFDGCCIVSNALGTFFVVFIEHSGVMLFYKLIDGYFILMYSMNRTFVNSAYPADVHAASRIYTLHSSINLDTEYNGLAVYTTDGFPIGLCKFSNIDNTIELEGLTKLSGDPNLYITDKTGTIYKTTPSIEFPFSNFYSTSFRQTAYRIIKNAQIFTSMPDRDMRSYLGELLTYTSGVVTRYPLTFGRNALGAGRQKLYVNIVWANGPLYECTIINGNAGATGCILKEYDGKRVKVDYTFYDTYLSIDEVTLFDGTDTRTLTGGNLYNTFYIYISAFDNPVSNTDSCLHTSYANIFTS